MSDGMRHLPGGQAVNSSLYSPGIQTVRAQSRRDVPDRREGFAPLSLSGAKGIKKSVIYSACLCYSMLCVIWTDGYSLSRTEENL